MARYIDLSDAAAARVQLADARKVNWDAALAECAARAEAVKASDASERRKAHRLEVLRVEYRSLLRSRHFAKTGINLSNVGKD